MDPPFEARVAVLKITVAALMTTSWIARFLEVPEGTDLVLIPGLCEGDPRVIQERVGVPVEKGPKDLREIPRYFGQAAVRAEYGAYYRRDPRRDQQRPAPQPGGRSRSGGLLPGQRRRPHRHRMHAGTRLPRPGRGGARAPRGGHARQRGQLRPGRDPDRRRGRRRAGAERQSQQPGGGPGARGYARPGSGDPRPRRGPRQPGAQHLGARGLGGRLSDRSRSSSRSASGSWPRSSATPRSAGAIPRPRS